MTAILVIFICLGAAYFLRRGGVFNERSHETLGRFVIWISVPALTFVNLRKIEFDPSLLAVALIPWLVFLGSMFYFRTLARTGLLERTDAGTIGALTLVCGLGNTSFVGFPMIEALIGMEGIPVATIYDQFGSFLVISTIGLSVAASASAQKASVSAVLWRIIKFPPFIAALLALCSRPFEIPDVVISAAQRLGSTLTPLALASIGCQLSFTRTEGVRMHELAWGLGYKLILAPVLVLVFFLPWAEGTPLLYQVSVIETGMGPMISAGIIASQLGLRSELNAKLIALGTLVSFATVPLLNWVATSLTR